MTDVNSTLEQCIARMADAQDALEAASAEWDAANNAPGGVDGQHTIEAAGQLDMAVTGYRVAANDLAQQIASLWRTGYRLRLERVP